MRVENVKLYNFKELKPEVQKRVIEKHYEINVNHEWWDCCLELEYLLPKKIQNEFTDKANLGRAIKDLKPIKFIFDYKNIYFDLYSSDYIKLEDLIVPAEAEDVFRKFLGIPKRLWEKVNYYFDNRNDRGNTKICFHPNYEVNSLTENEEATLEDAKDTFNDLMDKALDSLKKQYEYLTSEGAIEETLTINEYEFLENGEMW